MREESKARGRTAAPRRRALLATAAQQGGGAGQRSELQR
eukprot:gene26821-33462_t